jgi:hypothetical protein
MGRKNAGQIRHVCRWCKRAALVTYAEATAHDRDCTRAQRFEPRPPRPDRRRHARRGPT